MDFIKENSGNIMMVGGGLLAAAVLFWDKIYAKLKGFIPSGEEELDEHELVEILIERCILRKDEEGAMLISTYGKHLYDQKMEEAKDEPE